MNVKDCITVLKVKKYFVNNIPLKPLTYRERDMVLVFLKHLIDIDTWIDTPHNNRGRGASNNLIK